MIDTRHHGRFPQTFSLAHSRGPRKPHSVRSRLGGISQVKLFAIGARTARPGGAAPGIGPRLVTPAGFGAAGPV